MSEAKIRAEARKKKILERGSDRMAIATGQKATSGSTSWRKKRGCGAPGAETSSSSSSSSSGMKTTTVTADVVSDTPSKETTSELKSHDKSDEGKETIEETLKEEVLDLDVQEDTAKPTDALLDSILDDIDIDLLVPKQTDKDVKTKELASKKVLEATSDYNPMERQKSLAKRKALELEIVRQTEEFDRLADLARKSKAGDKKDHVETKEQKKDVGQDSSNNHPMLGKNQVLRLTKNQWVQIWRCLISVILGIVIGYWSHGDTRRIISQHPTSVETYMNALSTRQTQESPQALLEQFAGQKNDVHLAEEIVMTVVPTIWREDCSSLYALLHYPVIVVIIIMMLTKGLASRLIILGNTSAATNKEDGNILSSILSIVLGNFSGITGPIMAFLGDVSLFILAVMLTAAFFQGNSPLGEMLSGEQEGYASASGSAGEEF